MRTWLKREITRLEALRQQTEAIHETVASTIRETADRAAQAGRLDFYHEYKDIHAATPRDAVAILSSLLCSLSAEDDFLTIEEAAPLVGCSVSGLRKIVDRKAITYYQSMKGSPILFRREWLDEYVERNTFTPSAPKSRHGL